jgi:hypothetical protein
MVGKLELFTTDQSTHSGLTTEREGLQAIILLFDELERKMLAAPFLPI